jgi:hypothetical protein
LQCFIHVCSISPPPPGMFHSTILKIPLPSPPHVVP